MKENEPRLTLHATKEEAIAASRDCLRGPLLREVNLKDINLESLVRKLIAVEKELKQAAKHRFMTANLQDENEPPTFNNKRIMTSTGLAHYRGWVCINEVLVEEGILPATSGEDLG